MTVERDDFDPLWTSPVVPAGIPHPPCAKCGETKPIHEPLECMQRQIDRLRVQVAELIAHVTIGQ